MTQPDHLDDNADRTMRFCIALTPEEYQRFYQFAQSRNTTLSALARHLLAQAVQGRLPSHVFDSIQDGLREPAPEPSEQTPTMRRRSVLGPSSEARGSDEP